LELAKGKTHGFRQTIIEIARHLAQLHECALHVAQFGRYLLSSLHLAITRQLLSAFSASKYFACRCAGMGKTNTSAEASETTIATPP
jgi:hypothetical protein